MLSEDQIKELEVTHKRVAHVVGADGAWEVVYRKPSRAEYKRFRSMSHTPATVAEAQEFIARTCVVFPSREAFDVLLEDFPGVPEASGKALTALCGLSVDESVKP